MRNPLLAPEIRELLQEGRRDDLRELLEELHPNDAAAYLSALSNDEIVVPPFQEGRHGHGGR